MSNLEELIERLCPDGVEYKYLADVVTIKRGVRLIKKELKDNAKYPVYQNSLIPLGYYDDYNCEANKTMIITAGAAGDIVYSNTKFWAADDCFYFICNRYIDDKFLYYVLMSQQRGIYSKVRKASIPRLPRIVIEKIKLPVPPLEVQREIVRILDNFAIATTEIQQKLQEELAARQKQYEYYKVNLLLENNQSPNVTLNDIAINRDSQRKPVTSSKRESGNIPYYGASGIVDYVKDYIFDGDYLLVSEDGANLLARNTPIAFSIQGKTWVNNHAHILEFDNYYTRRYVEFYLNSIDLTPYISGGAQPKLNQKNLNSIKIPLPVLQEQQRIVGILDRFDTLCNDISSGLPAEIEMRQKQYEYYRDKLLTFKELKKEA